MRTTPSPDKSERGSSSSISMTSSPSPSTTTESTTTEYTITGSTTNESESAESSADEFTPSQSIHSESSDSDFTDSESTMAAQRTDAQWYELREGWTLHRFEEKTEFKCHQWNKQKKDILVAMKPEKDWDNMCCNACFGMKIGVDSDEWNLVHVDGVDHIW